MFFFDMAASVFLLYSCAGVELWFRMPFSFERIHGINGTGCLFHRGLSVTDDDTVYSDGCYYGTKGKKYDDYIMSLYERLRGPKVRQ